MEKIPFIILLLLTHKNLVLSINNHCSARPGYIEDNVNLICTDGNLDRSVCRFTCQNENYALNDNKQNEAHCNCIYLGKILLGCKWSRVYQEGVIIKCVPRSDQPGLRSAVNKLSIFDLDDDIEYGSGSVDGLVPESVRQEISTEIDSTSFFGSITNASSQKISETLIEKISESIARKFIETHPGFEIETNTIETPINMMPPNNRFSARSFSSSLVTLPHEDKIKHPNQTKWNELNIATAEKPVIEPFLTDEGNLASCDTIYPATNSSMVCSNGMHQGSVCDFTCDKQPDEFIYPIEIGGDLTPVNLRSF